MTYNRNLARIVIAPDNAESMINGVIADRLTTGESAFPRTDALATNISMTSQLLRLTYFTALKSEAITQVRMNCIAAAAATPSLIRVGIWTAGLDGALITQIAATTSDTTLLAANNTAYTKSFSASWDKVAGQRYGIGLLVVTAATAPQMQGHVGGFSPEMSISPRLNGQASGQTDLPSTLAVGSLTNTANRVYFALLP